MYEYENLIVFVDSRGGCAACSLVWVYSREEAGKCVRAVSGSDIFKFVLRNRLFRKILWLLWKGLACSGRNLVVYDLQSGESYVLFDALSGEYITRFGRIGRGLAKYLRAVTDACLTDVLSSLMMRPKM